MFHALSFAKISRGAARPTGLDTPKEGEVGADLQQRVLLKGGHGDVEVLLASTSLWCNSAMRWREARTDDRVPGISGGTAKAGMVVLDIVEAEGERSEKKGWVLETRVLSLFKGGEGRFYWLFVLGFKNSN